MANSVWAIGTRLERLKYLFRLNSALLSPVNNPDSGKLLFRAPHSRPPTGSGNKGRVSRVFLSKGIGAPVGGADS